MKEAFNRKGREELPSEGEQKVAESLGIKEFDDMKVGDTVSSDYGWRGKIISFHKDTLSDRTIAIVETRKGEIHEFADLLRRVQEG